MRRPRSLAALLAVATAVLLTTASSSPAAVTLGETSGNVNNCVDTQIYTAGHPRGGAVLHRCVAWRDRVLGAQPIGARTRELASSSCFAQGPGRPTSFPPRSTRCGTSPPSNQVNTVTGVRIPNRGRRAARPLHPAGRHRLLRTGGQAGEHDDLHGDHDAHDRRLTLVRRGRRATPKLDASAVVEPDADGDGYGDETQDGCPANGAVHDKCPATKKKKCKKKKKGKKRSSAAAKKKKGCKKKKKRK